MGMCKARASAGGMWGAHLRAREPRGSGLLEVVFMLASTLPRLPAARKPLNPCGIHPKRAGTAWDASRPWCGGLRPMPQPTVERLEPGARALQNLNTNLITFGPCQLLPHAVCILSKHCGNEIFATKPSFPRDQGRLWGLPPSRRC